MIESKFEVVQNIGLLIDRVDEDFINKKDFQVILPMLQEIDEFFNTNDSSDQEPNYLLVYYYTQSNYYTVFTKVASKHFAEIVKVFNRYSEYQSYNILADRFHYQSLTIMRQAVDIITNEENITINPVYRYSIFTNLSNIFVFDLRIIESIETLEPIKYATGMAIANYAAKLYLLSQLEQDEDIKKDTLEYSAMYYDLFLSDYQSDKNVYASARERFKHESEMIHKLLDTKYKHIKPHKVIGSVAPCKKNLYRKWCYENRLVLSTANIYQNSFCIDDLHLPNLGFGYYNKDKNLTYYSCFNTLKQEYNMARYYLYLARRRNSRSDVHVSQQGNFLINTLDYPSIGYKTELLKNSLKVAYGLFDKISLVCFDIASEHKQGDKLRKITFSNWYRNLENDNVGYVVFKPLILMATDFNFENGYYKSHRKLRDWLEHRYIRVLDDTSVPLNHELDSVVNRNVV